MDRSAMLRAAAVAAALAATACSRDEAPGTRDIAARVNGGEVPVRRVQAALAGNGSNDDADAKQVQARALEAAIDQELLVQKALAARLDRDPDVARALDDERRRILAQAWLDKAVARRARPDPAQVSAFYAANPALFRARRIYALHELRVAGAGERAAALGAVAAGGDRKAVEAWLARQGLAFESHDTTQPAEALPLALLAKLQSMKDGGLAVVDADGAVTVVQLLHSLPAPLGEREATPLIESFLASRQRMQLARDEIARLRGAARIEYVGGHGTPRHRGTHSASSRFALTASNETPYDQPTNPGFAASGAMPGKDERS